MRVIMSALAILVAGIYAAHAQARGPQTNERCFYKDASYSFGSMLLVDGSNNLYMKCHDNWNWILVTVTPTVQQVPIK